MKSSHDPDLTSWALNELSPADRAAYEEDLKKNPALLAEAQTTQNFCRFIQNHLCDDRAALTDSQRERLKSAARAGSLQIRDERKPDGKVMRAKTNQWWRRPAFVLPLSAAAAIALGLLPNLSKKDSPEHSNAGASPMLAAKATPKPELERSVLSPAAMSEPAANDVVQQLAAVEATPASPSGAAKVMNSDSGTAIFAGVTSETGAAVTNGVSTLVKIGGGAVVTLTGIDTYTGGLAVHGGVLLAGLSDTPASSNYFGKPTNMRGTMSAHVGRLNRASGGSISELADLSDISEKANIMVNGGVPR